MHSFRHTVASRALLAGESIDEIACLLGHLLAGRIDAVDAQPPERVLWPGCSSEQNTRSHRSPWLASAACSITPSLTATACTFCLAA